MRHRRLQMHLQQQILVLSQYQKAQVFHQVYLGRQGSLGAQHFRQLQQLQSFIKEIGQIWGNIIMHLVILLI